MVFTRRVHVSKMMPRPDERVELTAITMPSQRLFSLDRLAEAGHRKAARPQLHTCDEGRAAFLLGRAFRSMGSPGSPFIQ